MLVLFADFEFLVCDLVGLERCLLAPDFVVCFAVVFGLFCSLIAGVVVCWLVGVWHVRWLEFFRIVCLRELFCLFVVWLFWCLVRCCFGVLVVVYFVCLLFWFS